MKSKIILIIILFLSIKLKSQYIVIKHNFTVKNTFYKIDTVLFKKYNYIYKSLYLVTKSDTGLVSWKLIERKKLNYGKERKRKGIYAFASTI